MQDEFDGLDEDEDASCRMNPNASVNFNVDGLKDVLKCANCHR